MREKKKTQPSFEPSYSSSANFFWNDLNQKKAQLWTSVSSTDHCN
jgi:hypothetical protein